MGWIISPAKLLTPVVPVAPAVLPEPDVVPLILLPLYCLW